MKHRNIFCYIAVCATAAVVMVGCGKQQPTAEGRRAEKHRQDSISLTEQERSLVYYDSLYQTLLPQADSLMKEFRYEKNEKYEDNGKYTHKLLRSTQNTSRNYIQAYVGDNARTEVKFFYYGTHPIDLQEIVLSVDSLTDRFTGATHAFEAEGWHETMTLAQDDALRCLHFVDVYSNSRVRVSMEGNRSRAVFYISENDKKALISTYRLGVLMRDIQQLENRIRVTSIEISKYRKRLEKADTATTTE